MSLPYYIKHWFFTLAVSPVLVYLWQRLTTMPGDYVPIFFQVYPITVAMSVVFSFPTFIIYLVVFHLFKRKKVDTGMAKLILIGLTVAGIYITMRILLPEAPVWKAFRQVYPATAIIIGLLLELKYEES